MVALLLTNSVNSVVIPTKDTSHFVSCCAALENERVRLISSAPTSVQALLPDYVKSGKEFSGVILGIDWVWNCKTQAILYSLLICPFPVFYTDLSWMWWWGIHSNVQIVSTVRPLVHARSDTRSTIFTMIAVARRVTTSLVMNHRKLPATAGAV